MCELLSIREVSPLPGMPRPGHSTQSITRFSHGAGIILALKLIAFVEEQTDLAVPGEAPMKDKSVEHARIKGGQR